MHADLMKLSENFRSKYHCNNTPGVVENMFATIAGRDVNSTEPFTKEQLGELSNFLIRPPFKARHNLSKKEKSLIGTIFLGAVAVGVFVGWAES